MVNIRTVSMEGPQKRLIVCACTPHRSQAQLEMEEWCVSVVVGIMTDSTHSATTDFD